MAKNAVTGSKRAVASPSDVSSVTNDLVDTPPTPASRSAYDLLQLMLDAQEQTLVELRVTNFLLSLDTLFEGDLDRLRSDLS